ncbi:MAG: twin-arginine translocation signal domain-containing protein [Haloglomus sp.]
MDGQLPSRRQFLSATLAGAGITALAGCAESLPDDGGGGNGTKRELELQLSRQDGRLRESFVEDLSETRDPRDEAAFEAALNGEAYTTQYRRPFYSTPEDPEYVRHEGTYYRLGAVVVDEVQTTHPVLRLSSIEESGGESTPDGVAAESLPEGDRRAVRVAHMAARARGNEGGAPWGLVQRGGYVYRDEAAIEASELLADDGPDRVIYRETVYAVEMTRETFYEPVYRATAEPVAETPEQLEAILRAQFVDARFSREDRSQAARDVLREAENGGYSESHPYSDGFREVLVALHERAYLDGNIQKDAGVEDEGRRMLLYDGTYFDYRLQFTDG